MNRAERRAAEWQWRREERQAERRAHHARLPRLRADFEAPSPDDSPPAATGGPGEPLGEYQATTRWSLLGTVHRALFGDMPDDGWWEAGTQRIAKRLHTSRTFLDYAYDQHGLGASADLQDVVEALCVKGTPVLAAPVHTTGPLVGLVSQLLDDSELRRAMQRAAAEEFGLDWGRHGAAWHLPDDRYAVHGPALRAFLRAMYQETQQLLAARGIERLMLWRGMAASERRTPFARIPLDLQPLSSFTTRFDVAAGYADPQLGQILLVDAPRERVIGTPMTGFGEWGQQRTAELVLLSGPGYAWSLSWGSRAERRSVCTEANIRRLADRWQRAQAAGSGAA